MVCYWHSGFLGCLSVVKMSVDSECSMMADLGVPVIALVSVVVMWVRVAQKGDGGVPVRGGGVSEKEGGKTEMMVMKMWKRRRRRKKMMKMKMKKAQLILLDYQ